MLQRKHVPCEMEMTNTGRSLNPELQLHLVLYVLLYGGGVCTHGAGKHVCCCSIRDLKDFSIIKYSLITNQMCVPYIIAMTFTHT